MADSECVNNIGVVLGTGIGMGQPVWLQKQDFTAASPDDPSAQVHYLWVTLSNLNEFSVCEGRGWHDCMTARVHACGGWGLLIPLSRSWAYGWPFPNFPGTYLIWGGSTT
jgi:hypothetical protein